MGEGFFLSGLAANACVQAQGVTVSSEDALYLKANLQSGKPWEPFRWGTLGANPKIEFDCNIIKNPSFENDLENVSPPSDWKIPTGGGSPDVSTAASGEPDGTKSLRLNAANEAAYQDRIVRPGGTYSHSCQLHGDGTNNVSAYVLDLISGKWWTGSVWSTTKTAWATRSTASFALQGPTTFTLEDPVEGHVGPGRIRILFERPGSITSAAYVDAVYMWPKITVAALLYDTIPTAFTVAVESDDNSSFSSVTANGNLPARRFRRYLTFAGPGTLERYWRFIVTGTPVDGFIPWIGQPILGERRAFLTKPSWGIVTAREMPKSGTPEMPTSMAASPRHRFEMAWESPASHYQRVANEMLGASYFGDEPVMVVADVADTDSEFVYGRGAQMATIAPSRNPIDSLNYSLTIVDDPYPVVTKS